MRDGRSIESAVVGRGDTFLSDADFVAPTWPDTPAAGVMPQHPDKAKSLSVAMLLLGITSCGLFPSRALCFSAPPAPV